MSLAGLQVLVTRPQGQADALMTAIRRHGGAAVHCPVLAIAPLDAADQATYLATKQRIMALDQYQTVIFVSTNAVSFGMEWINQYWPQYPVGIRWYGVGAATVAALAEQDVVATAPQQAMDSEALLALLLLDLNEGDRILIIRGADGRNYLAEQLTQHGAVVDYACCYRRHVAEHSRAQLNHLVEQQQVNSVCVHSGDSLNYLCQLASPAVLAQLQHYPLVVPSRRVGEQAEQLGFGTVSVADNATSAAMVAALDALNRDNNRESI